MRIVAIVFGILGSFALFVAALAAFFTAGVNSLIGEIANDAAATEMGSTLAWHGAVGLISSIVALIGACLSIAKPRAASIAMLIGLIIGFIAMSAFSIPGVILLAIAVLFAFLGRKESRKREST